MAFILRTIHADLAVLEGHCGPNKFLNTLRQSLEDTTAALKALDVLEAFHSETPFFYEKKLDAIYDRIRHKLESLRMVVDDGHRAGCSCAVCTGVVNIAPAPSSGWDAPPPSPQMLEEMTKNAPQPYRTG